MMRLTYAPKILGLVLVALLSSVGLRAQGSDLISPPKRATTLAELKQFIAPKPGEPVTEELNNPFAPDAFSSRPAAAPSSAVAGPAPIEARGPSNDQELLELIAPLITPSGTMILGGRPLLLFGQKKVKEGDDLPITFEGAPYVLSIERIMPTSFTLRLNGALLTRPIKSGN